MADYSTRYVIQTEEEHGLSNGDPVWLDNTPVEALNGGKYAVEVLSTHACALLYSSYIDDDSGDYPDSAYISNPYGVLITSGDMRKYFKTLTADFSHLAGQTIGGLLDGSVVDDIEVPEDGAITLSDYVLDLALGLSYDTVFEPLGTDLAQETGSALGQTRRVREVDVRFKDTLGARVTTDVLTYYDICEVGTENNGGTVEYDTVVFRNTSDQISDTPELFTGLMEIPLEQRHSREPRIVFKQDAPLPFNVLGVTFKYEITEASSGKAQQ